MRLLLIAALLPLAACQSNAEEQGNAAPANGSGASRSFAAADFSRVELRGPDDVDVRTGAAFAVTAEGNSTVLDRLDIRVVDGALRIDRKRGFNWGDDEKVRVHVVMPSIRGAGVSGSGDLSVDKASGDFNGAVGGSGNLTVAQLRGGAADLSLAGSGDLHVAGTATKLSAALAGTGDIDAAKLTASSADVSIAGTGTVRAVVQGPADVSIIGTGDAELSGGAKCSVNAVGTGEARCS